MLRETRKYLYDISEAISSIDEYLTGNKDFESFRANKLLKRAIERELEIIGEATNRLLKLDPEIDISDARRIVDLRNWIIHAYDNVDDVIIWGVLARDVPGLKIQVEKLLKE